MNSIFELIRNRRSVRTFREQPLSAEHITLLEEHLQSVENPFGVPVDFQLLDVKEHGLSSPVILGAKQYIAGKVKRMPDCEIAFGYSFEEICLYAISLGIGTVMLAASLSRVSFEKAMQVKADEVLPCASPVGYPADKLSIRESLMRKGMKSDQRLAFEKLFYRGSFEHPLQQKDTGIFTDALEMMRLAPSATNQQPWRAVVDDNCVHFYERHSMPGSKLGDIQKVDVGISLCHFDLVMKEQNMHGQFRKLQPSISANEKLEYIISFEADA